mmetsp:Transcript_2396/g.7406  ORF Transcript_2396/g.7406 Transcript_2396/m.7406 type:complete len:94 (+) Transcript_2396:563-844(+)
MVRTVSLLRAIRSSWHAVVERATHRPALGLPTVTAMNTIKLLLAFGYKIVPPTPTQVSARAPKDPSAIEGDSSGDLAPDDNSTEQEGVAEAAG